MGILAEKLNVHFDYVPFNNLYLVGACVENVSFVEFFTDKFLMHT